jgi:tetratricopeptide (TPR) repeat protein
VNSGTKYNNRLKRYSIAISSLFIFALCACKAQNIEQIIELASRQFNMGSIPEAISLYRRVLYFDSLNLYSYEVARNLASCYISEKDYTKARAFSKMAGNLAPTDSLRTSLIFQVAYLYLLENDYNYALIEFPANGLSEINGLLSEMY